MSDGDVDGVRSVDPDELSGVFQPIVDLSTGELFALEGLARCTRPEFKNPTDLFKAAEEEWACGRLGRLLRDVLFERCGRERLFVNIHPQELTSRWLVRTDDPICYHDSQVYLEITESAAFDFFELCKSVLREVCGRTGAKLVVDDFGAGYSSLTRILELEPAVVKMDISLVRDIHRDVRKQAIIRHVLNLCEELGSKVVAEGIETVAELDAVRELGVHYGQGYLLARPAYPIPSVHWPY